jgi:hypothetical protein
VPRYYGDWEGYLWDLSSFCRDRKDLLLARDIERLRDDLNGANRVADLERQDLHRQLEDVERELADLRDAKERHRDDAPGGDW